MALSRTRLIKEKIAVFAPTPSASARMAVMVNAGAWRNMRMECLRSCMNDSMDWAALQTLGHCWIGKCSVQIGSSTYTAEGRNCFPKFIPRSNFIMRSLEGIFLGHAAADSASAGPVEAHVFADFVEHVDSADLALLRESAQKQVVANGVDHAGYALRPHVDLGHQLFGEDGLFRHARPLQAGLDVFHGIA